MSDIYHIYVDLVGMLVSLGICSNGLVHDENTDILEISFLKLEVGQWASRVVPGHRHFSSMFQRRVSSLPSPLLLTR